MHDPYSQHHSSTLLVRHHVLQTLKARSDIVVLQIFCSYKPPLGVKHLAATNL